MEVSNRCHYYPDIHHLTGTTQVIARWPLHPLVGCSHSVGFQCAISCLSTSKAPLRKDALLESQRTAYLCGVQNLRNQRFCRVLTLAYWSLAAFQHVAAYETCHPANTSKRLICCTSMHINVHHTPTYSWFCTLPQLSGPFKKRPETRCTLILSIRQKVLLISNPWRDRQRKAPARHRVHSHLCDMSNLAGPHFFNQISMCFRFITSLLRIPLKRLKNSQSPYCGFFLLFFVITLG